MSLTTPQSAPNSAQREFDITIIGAGVLGVCLGYWISQLYDCSICILDQEDHAAAHTSSRNTGVIHRPFYLNPEKRKIFARSAQKSYYMWETFARDLKLPWNQVGTLEVALRENDIATLERYREWSLKNGMNEDETDILNPSQVKQLESEIVCMGAIPSKTDTSVDYGSFTRTILEIAEKNGAKFLGNQKVIKMRETARGSEMLVKSRNGNSSVSERVIKSRLLINAAGGSSLDFAHMLDLAKEYADLHFRGEYWIV